MGDCTGEYSGGYLGGYEECRLWLKHILYNPMECL